MRKVTVWDYYTEFKISSVERKTNKQPTQQTG